MSAKLINQLLKIIAVLMVLIGCIGCEVSGDGSSTIEYTTGCAPATVHWMSDDGEGICVGEIGELGPGLDGLVEDVIIGEDKYTGSIHYMCDNGELKPLIADGKPQDCEFTPYRVASLALTADGDGRWYDYFSDSFTQIDRLWAGSQIPDGFFSPIAAGDSASEIGTGQDQFPDEGNWKNFGSIFYDTGEYDDIGLYEAPIVGVNADLDLYVKGEVAVINRSYDTSFPDEGIVGTVYLNDGNIIDVELHSAITLSWGKYLGADLFYFGTFIINRDDRFEMIIGTESSAEQASIDFAEGRFDRMSYWDFSGVVEFAKVD